MLELDSRQEFDSAREEEFFAWIPQRAGVLLVEPRAAGAQPHLVRTADLRRAAERLLRPPEPLSRRLNLREVAAAIRYRVTGSKFEQTLTLYRQAKQYLPERYRDLLRLRRLALLKVNLRNEYPRCYVTRRLRADGGFYFGPFASRRAADAFAEGFLDLFKIRRCQIKIRRDPSYPGCIYSEMKMCLAPCFAGCTKEEYDAEVTRVLETLDSTGASLIAALERERAEASEALNFERAALLHKRIEKASDALRGLPELARRIENLDAVILQRAADEKTVALFIVRGGWLDKPVFLRFGELSSQPQSIDAILRQTLQPPFPVAVQSSESAPPPSSRETYGLHAAPPELAEHLALIARWFYSKPREGEILFRDKEWPYRRILRAIGRLVAPPGAVQGPGKGPVKGMVRRLPRIRRQIPETRRVFGKAAASMGVVQWMFMADTAAPALASRSRFKDVTRSLRHRNFKLFFSGQLISLIGTWMDTVAEAWLVYRLTGSSLLLGTVAFASQFPVFLFAALGGLIADRWDRRKVVIVTQTLSMILAFILAFLTLSRRVTVNEVILLATLMGMVNAVDLPTRQSFLVEMVGREDLMNAIALNSSMFNGARIVGPAIAGILVAGIGEGWCFFANAVSYIAVIAGLLMMRVPARAIERHPSPLAHLLEGFRFARDTAPIRAVLVLVGAISILALPYSVLMPVFAAKVLHGNARSLGILMGATGVGALIGALKLASRTKVEGLGRTIAIACGSFGACLILFSQSRWILLSTLLMIPAGFSMMTQMASSNTLIQAMVPDRLRGRTMAIYAMMLMGVAPLGSLLAGAIADRVGAPFTVAFGGACAIGGAIAFWRYLPKIRAEARELIVAQSMALDDPSRILDQEIAEEVNSPNVS